MRIINNFKNYHTVSEFNSFINIILFISFLFASFFFIKVNVIFALAPDMNLHLYQNGTLIKDNRTYVLFGESKFSNICFEGICKFPVFEKNIEIRRVNKDLSSDLDNSSAIDTDMLNITFNWSVNGLNYDSGKSKGYIAYKGERYDYILDITKGEMRDFKEQNSQIFLVILPCFFLIFLFILLIYIVKKKNIKIK